MSKKALLLQKPSGTIVIGGNISERERKLYNGFLKIAHSHLAVDPEQHWFEIPLKSLKGFLRLTDKDKNNSHLRKILKRMEQIRVEYNILKKDKYIEGHSRLLHDVELETSKNTALVRFSIPERVRRALLRGSKSPFANIDLIIVKGLKSKYAVILYEIVCDYKDVEIPAMTISDFRKIFGIENKYSKMRDVQRRILEPACQELNENPDVPFEIDYNLMKRGKGNRITHIKFYFKTKEAAIPIELNDPDIEDLVSLLPESERNKKTILHALKKYKQKYGFNYCERNIKYTNLKSTQNYRNFLIAALKSDWALAWWEDEQEKVSRQQILKSICNAQFELRGVIYQSDNEGFIYGKNWVLPPGEVLDLLQKKKIKILNTKKKEA